jgi:hypothetical protein
VDTVVTRCRGRENDEKRVAAEIYDAGNARQRDGGAKRMTGQSSLSLFFRTQTKQTWADRLAREQRPSLRCCVGERARHGGRDQAGARARSSSGVQRPGQRCRKLLFFCFTFAPTGQVFWAWPGAIWQTAAAWPNGPSGRCLDPSCPRSDKVCAQASEAEATPNRYRA